MTDICERLVRFKDKVCISSDVEIEAAAIIDKMFAKNADYRRRMSSFIFDYRNLEGECEALRAENARLTEMLGNVSRGVQAIRVEQNVAAVWLPAIQEIRAYFRELDDARKAMGESDE